MSSILKVDQLQDSGGNSIISSNGSGTFTPGSLNIANAQIASNAAIATTKLGTGAVLQVVHQNLSPVTVNTGTATSCGSASITPTATTSNILIFCNTVVHGNNADAAEYYDTRVTLSSATGTILSRLNDAMLYQVNMGNGFRQGANTSFIHSPASISQQTYHLTAIRSGGTGSAIFNQNSAGNFVLMEIAG